MPASSADAAAIKAEIVQALDEHASRSYFAALKSFLTSKSTKSEFDRVVRDVLGADKIRLHNQLVRAMLHTVHTSSGPALTPNLMPRGPFCRIHADRLMGRATPILEAQAAADRRGGKDQFRRPAEKRQKGAQGQIVDRRMKSSEYSASQRSVPLQSSDQAMYEEDDFDILPVTDSAVPIDPDVEDDPANFYQSQPRDEWLQADTEDVLDMWTYLPSEDDDAVRIGQRAQEEGMAQAAVPSEFVRLAHLAKERFLLDIIQVLVGVRPSNRIAGGTLTGVHAGIKRLQRFESQCDELDDVDDPEQIYKMYGVGSTDFLYMHQHRMFSNEAAPVGKDREASAGRAPPHTVTVEDAITALRMHPHVLGEDKAVALERIMAAMY